MKQLILPRVQGLKNAKLILSGGFGGHNLGDEAILWALSRQLRRLQPATKQYVLVRHGLTAEARSQYNAWRIEPLSGFFWTYFKVLRRARLIVGGGHLIDDISIGWPTVVTSLLVFTNWLFGNGPIFLFVGAERVTRKLPLMLVKAFYSRAEICICRDPSSTEALLEAGMSHKKLVTAKDAVFSLDRTLLPQWKAGNRSAKPKVVMVIAYDRRRMRDSNISSINLIECLLKSGYVVELIAHDIRPGYDMGALSKVEKKFAGHANVVFHRARSPQEAFTIYSRADAVISGRMHPLIMAALVGTLPVAFGGRVKVQSLIEIAGIPFLNAGIAAEQVSQIGRILAQRASFTQRISHAIDKFRGEVEESITRALPL